MLADRGATSLDMKVENCIFEYTCACLRWMRRAVIDPQSLIYAHHEHNLFGTVSSDGCIKIWNQEL